MHDNYILKKLFIGIWLILIAYRENFLKELALWQKLRHPNIVQFLGVLNHPDRLIFLTEYLRNVSVTF